MYKFQNLHALILFCTVAFWSDAENELPQLSELPETFIQLYSFYILFFACLYISRSLEHVASIFPLANWTFPGKKRENFNSRHFYKKRPVNIVRKTFTYIFFRDLGWRKKYKVIWVLFSKLHKSFKIRFKNKLFSFYSY